MTQSERESVVREVADWLRKKYLPTLAARIERQFLPPPATREPSDEPVPVHEATQPCGHPLFDRRGAYCAACEREKSEPPSTVPRAEGAEVTKTQSRPVNPAGGGSSLAALERRVEAIEEALLYVHGFNGALPIAQVKALLDAAKGGGA